MRTGERSEGVGGVVGGVRMAERGKEREREGIRRG